MSPETTFGESQLAIIKQENIQTFRPSYLLLPNHIKTTNSLVTIVRERDKSSLKQYRHRA